MCRDILNINYELRNFVWSEGWTVMTESIVLGGGEFSILIFTFFSMLGVDSFDVGMDMAYFLNGSKNFQKVKKDINKTVTFPCMRTTLSNVFLSSIEFQGVFLMV